MQVPKEPSLEVVAVSGLLPLPLQGFWFIQNKILAQDPTSHGFYGEGKCLLPR